MRKWCPICDKFFESDKPGPIEEICSEKHPENGPIFLSLSTLNRLQGKVGNPSEPSWNQEKHIHDCCGAKDPYNHFKNCPGNEERKRRLEEDSKLPHPQTPKIEEERKYPDWVYHEGGRVNKYKLAEFRGQFGSRMEASWNTKIQMHTCCKSKVSWCHKSYCPNIFRRPSD